MRVERDIPYGRRPAQRLDLYLPAGAASAPVIVLVHGGAWITGDKSLRIEHKVEHWVPRGYAVAAVNYRLLPWAGPREQAADVAQALAKLQTHVARWGGDGSRLVLVGHSTGAHLGALAIADAELGAPKLAAAVLMDSAALDVVQVMRGPHLPLHDRAFGAHEADWQLASPRHRLQAAVPPLLLACSSQRADSLAQNEAFAARARELGATAVELAPFDLPHSAFNEQLGQPGALTERVDAFLRAHGLP